MASDEGLGTEWEINSAPDQPSLFLARFVAKRKKRTTRGQSLRSLIS
ncbi:hypothetical protein SynA1524_00811 [Synechococcus sp. A15-24]|nr:hypothetical protein SynA1524_00811 [Synechococcus sp. A15-24]